MGRERERPLRALAAGLRLEPPARPRPARLVRELAHPSAGHRLRARSGLRPPRRHAFRGARRGRTRGAPGAATGEGERTSRRGARAVAGPSSRRLRLPGVGAARDRSSRRAQARHGRGSDRGRPGARTPRGARGPAGAADGGASLPRGARGAADGRPLPLRAAGRRAGGVSRGTNAAGRHARHRAGCSSQGAREADSRAGSDPGGARRRHRAPRGDGDVPAHGRGGIDAVARAPRGRGVRGRAAGASACHPRSPRPAWRRRGRHAGRLVPLRLLLGARRGRRGTTDPRGARRGPARRPGRAAHGRAPPRPRAVHRPGRAPCGAHRPGGPRRADRPLRLDRGCSRADAVSPARPRRAAAEGPVRADPPVPAGRRGLPAAPDDPSVESPRSRHALHRPKRRGRGDREAARGSDRARHPHRPRRQRQDAARAPGGGRGRRGVPRRAHMAGARTAARPGPRHALDRRNARCEDRRVVGGCDRNGARRPAAPARNRQLRAPPARRRARDRAAPGGVPERQLPRHVTRAPPARRRARLSPGGPGRGRQRRAVPLARRGGGSGHRAGRGGATAVRATRPPAVGDRARRGARRRARARTAPRAARTPARPPQGRPGRRSAPAHSPGDGQVVVRPPRRP